MVKSAIVLLNTEVLATAHGTRQDAVLWGSLPVDVRQKGVEWGVRNYLLFHPELIVPFDETKHRVLHTMHRCDTKYYWSAWPLYTPPVCDPNIDSNYLQAYRDANVST
jgi:hypothetical protein